MESDCGNCSLCCKLLGIADLGPAKPANEWCPHCPTKQGCGVYDTRPPSCREFACLWLQSQHVADQPLPLFMRPDKSKVVVVGTEQEDLVYAHVDPDRPHAWKEGATWVMLKGLAENGIRVLVGHGPTPNKILVECEPGGYRATTKEIVMSEPDENGVQWYEPTP